LEFAAEWQVSVIIDERIMGSQDDMPIKRHEYLQSSRLHKPIQPMKQLEEFVEEIRELMLSSAEEEYNKEKLE
jgi:hypothetical protein